MQREVVREAAGVVRQHHLRGVPALAQRRDRLDALLGRRAHPRPEAVHPDRAAALHQPAEVVEVRRVAGVADHHAAQVHALRQEDALLLRTRAGLGIGVRHDRHAGLTVRQRDGAKLQLVVRGYLFLRRDLERARAHPAVGDALLDVPHVQLDDALRRAPPEVARRTQVHPRRHDDLDPRALRDLLHRRDVSPEVDRGQVQDRPHAVVVRLVEHRDGVVDVCRAIEEMRPVRVHVARPHQHVLVHERETQLATLNRAVRRGHQRHQLPPFVRRTLPG